MTRRTKFSAGIPPEVPDGAYMLEKLCDAELDRLCRKHRINRQRCGLCRFEGRWEKYGAIRMISEAAKYPGCISEFLGYVNQDAPLRNAGEFIAIMWAAVESYKGEAGQ